MTLTEQAIATIAAGCEGPFYITLNPATVLALCALAQEALQSRREGQQMREATIEECARVAEDVLRQIRIIDFDTAEVRPGTNLEAAAAIRALSHPKPESVNRGASDAE